MYGLIIKCGKKISDSSLIQNFFAKTDIYYIFASQPGKNELMAISIPINFIKFRKYVDGFTTSKADGSSLNTKQSERIMPSYFQKCPQPVETTLVAIHFCGEQKNCGQPMFLWLRIYRQPSRTAGGPPTQGITIYERRSHKTRKLTFIKIIKTN